MGQNLIREVATAHGGHEAGFGEAMVFGEVVVGGEGIEVRGFDVGGSGEARIGVAHIISHDDDDVRLVCESDCSEEKESDE